METATVARNTVKSIPRVQMNQHIYIYSVFTHASSFSVFILFLFFHVLLPVLFFAIPQWFRLRLIARTATERTIIQIIPAILSFRVASLPCTMLVRHCNKRLPISLYCRFIQSSHHVFVMIGCKPRILVPECGQVKALSPVGKEGVLHSSCARIVTI